MDTQDLRPMIEDLRERVDDLEVALAPLLRTNLSDVSAKLPLLDKAKLSVLTTYALESILFSVLKLNGVNAKEHPVFQELARVKQYFEKIKQAEAGAPLKRKLDNQVANRLIKNALTGNDKYDRDRVERQAREKANAHQKLAAMSGELPQAKRPRVDGPAHQPMPGPLSSPTSSSSDSDEEQESLKILDPSNPSMPSNELDHSSESSKPKREASNVKAPPAIALALPSDPKAEERKRKEEKKIEKARKKEKKRLRQEKEGKKATKVDKAQGESKADESRRKKKSSKAPRDSKSVFRDLLGRPAGSDGP